MSRPTPPPPPVKMSLPTPPLPPVREQKSSKFISSVVGEPLTNDMISVPALAASIDNIIAHESGDEQDQSNIDEQQLITVDGDEQQLITAHESGDDCDDPHAQKEQKEQKSVASCEGDIACLSGCLIGIKRKEFEDIYDLYSKHAYEVGFSVRRSTTRYNVVGEIISKSLVCSCEGTRKPSSNNDVKGKNKGPLITRTNCKASLKAKMDVHGVFEVVEHHLDHNHILSRSEWSYMHRSQRSISAEKAVLIEDMISSGIKASDSFKYMAHEAGGEHVLGHTKKDHFNFVNRMKIDAIEGGDAQTLIDNLYQQGVEDQDFFFRVKLDDYGRLCNVFWRDSMMKEDYMIYGDVVVFDTTYRTNKYNLICAPFVGINNHRKNVMFGCAFISNEKTGSFEWLFEVFRKSMDGRSPVTLFTDQDMAMSNAIAKVFPTTRHRLCIWHLYQNAQSHLGRLKSNKSFNDVFQKCLTGCANEEEFEICWSSMISSYQLQDNSWFKRLYNLREKWCNAYNKDFFSAGILSSQRSGSTNSTLGFNAKKTTSLNDFYTIFKRTVERWRHNEANDEFQCSRGQPTSCFKLHGLLKHASEVYTLTLFNDFESEFKDCIATSVTFLYEEDDIILYNVTHVDGITCYVVTFYTKNTFVTCSCKRFEECGLLCCHCLRILLNYSVSEIPECYIKKRWTKFAKQGLWDKFEVASGKSKNYSTWRHQMMRKYYNLLLKAQENEDDRTIIEDGMNSITSALEASIGARQTRNVMLDVEASNLSANVLDPARSNTKGRKQRIRGHLEKSKNKKKKTSNTSNSNQFKEFGSKTPNPKLF